MNIGAWIGVLAVAVVVMVRFNSLDWREAVCFDVVSFAVNTLRGFDLDADIDAGAGDSAGAGTNERYPAKACKLLFRCSIILGLTHTEPSCDDVCFAVAPQTLAPYRHLLIVP